MQVMYPRVFCSGRKHTKLTFMYSQDEENLQLQAGTATWVSLPFCRLLACTRDPELPLDLQPNNNITNKNIKHSNKTRYTHHLDTQMQLEPASHPDVSLSMKICAQRKDGRRKRPLFFLLPMVHCASSLVTPVSRSPKNEAVEKEAATRTVVLYVSRCALQNKVRK